MGSPRGGPRDGFRTLAVSGRASGACISSCMLEGSLQESGLRDDADAKASATDEACEMQIMLGIPCRRFVARPVENQQQSISPAPPLIRCLPLTCFGGTAGLCGFERIGQRRLG